MLFIFKNVVKKYKELGYDLTLVGQSIGTGPTIDLVSKYKWKNPVILISPYISLPS
jgi:hypothetical protein